MSFTEFAILGDTHLERLSTYFPNKDWINWSLRPFYQIEEYCLEHGIKYVIQTGDLFDVAEPSQSTICALVDFLLQSKVKEWHFSLGNHDIESRAKHSLILLKFFSQQKKLKNCFFYPNTKQVKIGGISVVFLPYPKTKSKLLNKKSKLVIAHVERKGAKYDSGRIIKDHSFKLGKHFWVIGHLHEYQAGAQHVFVGAPLQLRYGDGKKKYFLHLKVKQSVSNIKVKYSKHLIAPPYVFQDATVDKLEDIPKTFDKLKDNIFLRLFINSEIAIPEKWISHPQVIKHRFYGDKKDIKVMKAEIFDLKSAKLNTHSRMAAIKVWLKTKTKFTKEQRIRAIFLAKEEEKRIMEKIK